MVVLVYSLRCSHNCCSCIPRPQSLVGDVNEQRTVLEVIMHRSKLPSLAAAETGCHRYSSCHMMSLLLLVATARWRHCFRGGTARYSKKHLGQPVCMRVQVSWQGCPVQDEQLAAAPVLAWTVLAKIEHGDSIPLLC